MFDITRQFDLPILDWIADHLWCPFLDALMPAITFLADAGWIWIAVALILLFIPKYRKTGITMGCALLLGLVICNLWLKPWIGRIRPFDYQLQNYSKVIPLPIQVPTDFSFPSGHTIASFESATVLLIRHKKWGIPALVGAILIAFSRLYLYVHYPTDVLTSIALGISIGLLCNHLINKGYSLYQRKKSY